MHPYTPPFAGRRGPLAKSLFDPETETDAERNLRVLCDTAPTELEFQRALIRADAITLRLSILTGHLTPPALLQVETRLAALTTHTVEHPTH